MVMGSKIRARDKVRLALYCHENVKKSDFLTCICVSVHRISLIHDNARKYARTLIIFLEQCLS